MVKVFKINNEDVISNFVKPDVLIGGEYYPSIHQRIKSKIPFSQFIKEIESGELDFWDTIDIVIFIQHEESLLVGDIGIGNYFLIRNEIYDLDELIHVANHFPLENVYISYV